MGKHERQTYLKAIRSRYWRAGKMAKVTILDEFCAVCGYHRKYAIRLLNQRGKPRIKRMPGRKPIYGLDRPGFSGDPGAIQSAARVSAFSSRHIGILLMTTRSSMQAMTFMKSRGMSELPP